MNALPPHLQHLQHLQGEELKATVQKEYMGQAMAFILRQTDYDEDTAFKRLCEFKDPVKVVSEYLGVKPRSEPQPTTKNQMKYGEIRKFMDYGARQYNMQNERRRQLQQLQESQESQEKENTNQSDETPTNEEPKSQGSHENNSP